MRRQVVYRARKNMRVARVMRLRNGQYEVRYQRVLPNACWPGTQIFCMGETYAGSRDDAVRTADRWVDSAIRRW